jgi:hypothetical protein
VAPRSQSVRQCHLITGLPQREHGIGLFDRDAESPGFGPDALGATAQVIWACGDTQPLP